MPEPISITLLTTSVIAGLIRYAQRKFQQAKVVFDVAIGFFLLILLSPVIGAVALLVRLIDGNPVIYRQVRVGKGGRLFNMFKFRTMVINAEEVTGPVWADDNDPRCTRLGRILRKTYLDELPQLVNVIQGEMSLVGPRPERPHFVQRLTSELPDYPQRLSVKPGITGLAQVRYRAERNISDSRTKLQFDLAYIKNMSWSTDFKILLATFSKVGSPKKHPELQAASPSRNSGKISN